LSILDGKDEGAVTHANRASSAGDCDDAADSVLHKFLQRALDEQTFHALWAWLENNKLALPNEYCSGYHRLSTSIRSSLMAGGKRKVRIIYLL